MGANKANANITDIIMITVLFVIFLIFISYTNIPLFFEMKMHVRNETKIPAKWLSTLRGISVSSVEGYEITNVSNGF